MLDKVNRYLSKKDNDTKKETDIILSGPNTIQNILANEFVKLGRLDVLSNNLLDYIADEKNIKKLSYKERQYLLESICRIQSNSRDFILKVAELSAKNSLLKEMLKTVQEPQVISETTGEVFTSQVSDDTRRELSDLLRQMINETE